MQLTLLNVRLSYPHLFKAKAAVDAPGSEPKFSASFILDKKTQGDQIKKVQEAIDTLIKEEKLKVDPDKRCLKDGAVKPDTYGDTVYFINSSSTLRPQVVDRKKTPVAEADNIVYGGCYVNAVIRLWAQNNQFGKRINASLEVVQFVKDGEAFGRKPVDVDEALPDLDDEGDGLD
jgi:hypothetical protein